MQGPDGQEHLLPHGLGEVLRLEVGHHVAHDLRGDQHGPQHAGLGQQIVRHQSHPHLWGGMDCSAGLPPLRRGKTDFQLLATDWRISSSLSSRAALREPVQLTQEHLHRPGRVDGPELGPQFDKRPQGLVQLPSSPT